MTSCSKTLWQYSVILLLFSLNLNIFSLDNSHEIWDNLTDETIDYLEELGIDEISFDDLFELNPTRVIKFVLNMVTNKASHIKDSFVLIFIVLVMSSISSSFVSKSGKYNKLIDYICILIIMSFIMEPIGRLLTDAASAIKNTTILINVYLPIMTGIIFASKSPALAVTYNSFTIFISNIIAVISDKIFVPLISVIFSLNLISTFSSDSLQNRLTKTIRRLITVILSLFSTIFTGLLTTQSILASSSDSIALKGFEPSKLEYDYILTTAVTECPDITVEKENGQNISITVPRVTGVARIEVTPETGSKNVYTINIKYPQSSNSKLASIMLDSVQIEGWNPDVTEYKMQILDGNVPTVTYKSGDDKQIVVAETNAITGDTKFIVKAEDGTVTTYTVTFERTKSSIATLADLSIDGVSIIKENVYAYNYVLTDGTTTAPKITYARGDDKQNVTLITPALDGEAKLVVVAEDMSDTTIYTINFAFELSSNANLGKIVLTQRAVAYEKELTDIDFANSDTVFIDWIDGVVAPTIAYAVEEEKQMVAFADAGLNGAEILVVAEDGTQREYVIRYNFAKTNIAQLSDLQIWNAENNEFITINGFKYDKYVYNVELP